MGVVVDIVMIQTITQEQFCLHIKSRMVCVKMKSTHATEKWALQRNKNRWIQLKGLHPCITSNSNHVMNHLRDYNCSVRTYPHRISCMTNCTVVTFQMIYFMVWIGWQQGCQHVSWICLLWQTTRGVNNKHMSWGGWTSPPPPRAFSFIFTKFGINTGIILL